jgi:hypothetical protein
MKYTKGLFDPPPSFVPEKVGVNKKAQIKHDIPIRNKGLA